MSCQLGLVGLIPPLQEGRRNLCGDPQSTGEILAELDEVAELVHVFELGGCARVTKIDVYVVVQTLTKQYIHNRDFLTSGFNNQLKFLLS